MNVDAHRLITVPATMPAPTSIDTRDSTMRMTRLGVAPSARRMPISARRRAIANAVTPYSPVRRATGRAHRRTRPAAPSGARASASRRAERGGPHDQREPGIHGGDGGGDGGPQERGRPALRAHTEPDRVQ